ncbi:MAG: ABC transporter substrate-binding protein [Desulfobacterales bacterium]|nr:ABC transporter substrate-binding protein [Desulfobacterales bacterium]
MTHRIVKISFAVLIVVICATGAWAGKKNIVYATSADVTTWDPSTSYSTELTYMINIYETLIRVNPPGSAEPFSYLLATGFTASDDGLVYTFHLRKGVKFHDGTPFTAKAVKLSIDRTSRLGQGAAFIWKDLEAIKIIDDHTIRLIMKKPVPVPQIAASAYASYIMSPSVVDKNSAWFDEGNECGTGPYRLENYNPGESMMLTRFKDYWGGWEKNQPDNVLVKMSWDSLVKLQMLQSKEAAIVNAIPSDSYKSVRDGRDTQVVYGPSYINYLLFFNTSRAPLDNVKVRQALAHALPYKDMIDVAFAGKATQPRGIVPKGQFGHDENVRQYCLDLDKAKGLLAEAGFGGKELKLVMSYCGANQAEARMAPLLKDQLKKIGVDLQLKPLSWPAQWEEGKRAEKDGQDLFFLMWWPTYSDPYETLVSLLGTEEKTLWNFAYYSNPAYDALIRKAYETVGSDMDAALKMYVEAQNIIQDDMPAVAVADAKTAVPALRNLDNIIVNPAYPGGLFFYDMSLK